MKKIILYAYLLFITVSCVNNLKPDEVVIKWNSALCSGDVDFAKKHTSKTSLKYLTEIGGLESLSQKYMKGPCANTKRISENVIIDDKIARVIYTVYYPNGKIKKWEDTCFNEDGIWKVAPQFVRTIIK